MNIILENIIIIISIHFNIILLYKSNIIGQNDNRRLSLFFWKIYLFYTINLHIYFI